MMHPGFTNPYDAPPVLAQFHPLPKRGIVSIGQNDSPALNEKPTCVTAILRCGTTACLGITRLYFHTIYGRALVYEKKLPLD